MSKLSSGWLAEIDPLNQKGRSPSALYLTKKIVYAPFVSSTLPFLYSRFRSRNFSLSNKALGRLRPCFDSLDNKATIPSLLLPC